MAFIVSNTSSASVASMAARLASKLSLSHQDEPVDLGNLKCPDRGFVAPRFYLVGKLNTARAVAFDAFRSAVRSMWRLSSPVEVQARGDRFLFTFTNLRDVARVKKGGPWSFQRAMILINDYDGFSDIMAVPLDFVWIWVEIFHLPAALTTEATARLVGETIGPVLQVDTRSFTQGRVRVRLTLSLHDPVFLHRRLRISPEDIITVEYRYERLLGRCGNCMMINHGGLRCPRVEEMSSDEPVTESPAPPPTIAPMVFRANSQPTLEAPSVIPGPPKEKRQIQVREHEVFESPPRVSGGRRRREDEEGSSGKKGRHGLTLGFGNLTPTKLGLQLSPSGALGIKRSGKSPAKQGRLRGSRSGKSAARKKLNPAAEAELQQTVAELVAQSRIGPDLGVMELNMGSSSGQGDGELGLTDGANEE